MKCARCGSTDLRRDSFGNFWCRQRLGPCGHLWRYRNNIGFGKARRGTEACPWWQPTVTTPRGSEHRYHAPQYHADTHMVVAILKPRHGGVFRPPLSPVVRT